MNRIDYISSSLTFIFASSILILFGFISITLLYIGLTLFAVSLLLLSIRRRHDFSTSNRFSMVLKAIYSFFLTFIIIPSVLSSSMIFYAPMVANYLNQTSFNSQQWKHWEANTETPSLRWDMSNNLVSRYQLQGMTRNQIIKLLGKPENKNKNSMTYDLGMARYSIDVGALYIFLKNGRVSSWEVRTLP